MNGVPNECYVDHLVDSGLSEPKEGPAGSIPRYMRIGSPACWVEANSHFDRCGYKA